MHARLSHTRYTTQHTTHPDTRLTLLSQAALLEIGLQNWAMQRLVQRGFTPVVTPDLVKHKIAEVCAHTLPHKTHNKYPHKPAHYAHIPPLT